MVRGIIGVLLFLLAGCSFLPTASAPREVILATTTSVQDSGLLEVLMPLFEEESGFQLKPVSVGTGAALELAGRGEADVVLVHAPEAEREWLAAGNGAGRFLIMHNDFIIVGPATDPAGIRGMEVLPALRGVAENEALWVSRDDSSGTAQLEESLWADAGISLGGAAWRLRSGQGMGATLMLADERGAYTLSDRGTYLSRLDTIALDVLVEGDPRLLNLYHVMPVNAERFPERPINPEGAQAFVDFLLSPAIQELIGEYGVEEYGQPLFIPDGGRDETELLGSP